MKRPGNKFLDLEVEVEENSEDEGDDDDYVKGDEGMHALIQLD